MIEMKLIAQGNGVYGRVGNKGYLIVGNGHTIDGAYDHS